MLSYWEICQCALLVVTTTLGSKMHLFNVIIKKTKIIDKLNQWLLSCCIIVLLALFEALIGVNLIYILHAFLKKILMIVTFSGIGIYEVVFGLFIETENFSVNDIANESTLTKSTMGDISNIKIQDDPRETKPKKDNEVQIAFHKMGSTENVDVPEDEEQEGYLLLTYLILYSYLTTSGYLCFILLASEIELSVFLSVRIILTLALLGVTLMYSWPEQRVSLKSNRFSYGIVMCVLATTAYYSEWE